jgi:predicted phosphodiesterase
VVAEVTRIISDLHYGDPASRVRSLDALQPLFAGADRVVFNGDSVETRQNPIPQKTAEVRQEFIEFTRNAVPGCTVITGNHDPDLSTIHQLELLGGLVLVTHGEVLFENLVPWSRELPQIREFYRQELAALPAATRELPGERLAACKRACARFELLDDPHPRHPWGRFRRTLRIFWPPRCTVAMIKAWSELPERAEAFALQFRPGTRFVMVGHTHWPGVWIRPDIVVVNTGSFRPPFGCYAVDVSAEQVVVRKVRHSGGRFALGRVVAAFSLAPTRDGLPDSGGMMPDLAPAP